MGKCCGRVARVLFHFEAPPRLTNGISNIADRVDYRQQRNAFGISRFFQMVAGSSLFTNQESDSQMGKAKATNTAY